MNSPTDALHVADCLLLRARAHQSHLTPLQLIKLVYICHGWMLALYKRPLFGNTIEAWRYGPIIPDLYHAIKKFRDQPVQHPLAASGSSLAFDEEAKSIIDQVYDHYGQFTGIELSGLTHQEGTPWHMVYDPAGASDPISNEVIQDYYLRLHYLHLQSA